MERTYIIHVDDEKVHFSADGKVIFKRCKDFVSIVTRGTKTITIIDNEDGSTIESFFPSNLFSLELVNGSYTVTIVYSN